MSQQNVALVREIFEAINGEDMERVLEFTHPDFAVHVPPELSAEPDTYRGHEGMRRYWESFRDAMEEIRFRAERYWDAGEVVVVAMQITARGRRTAIPVEQRLAALWTIRDRKAVQIRIYASLAQALQAVGLPPT